MITDILKISIFISFITFIFWSRLIREHLPRNLLELNNNLFYTLLTCLTISFFLGLIIISLLLIFKIKVKPSRFEIIKRMAVIWKEYVVNASETVLAKISKKINITPRLTNPISYIVVHFNYPRFIVVGLMFFPTILVASIFFIEVVYFHYIFLFYNLLPILFVPLFVKGLIYTTDQMSLAMIEYVTPHMTCEEKGDVLILNLAPVSPNIPNALSLERMSTSLEWLVCQYEIHTTIKGFCDDINNFKNKYMSWYMLIYSILYFISWSVYLVFLLSN